MAGPSSCLDKSRISSSCYSIQSEKVLCLLVCSILPQSISFSWTFVLYGYFKNQLTYSGSGVLLFKFWLSLPYSLWKRTQLAIYVLANLPKETKKIKLVDSPKIPEPNQTLSFCRCLCYYRKILNCKMKYKRDTLVISQFTPVKISFPFLSYPSVKINRKTTECIRQQKQ